MKTIKLFTLIALFIGLTSCSSDDTTAPGSDSVEMIGSFSREFDAGGAVQRATYTISEDNVNYDLAGGFAKTNYDTTRKYFTKSEGRWIGYSSDKDQFYVLFFKNVSENEITLYKKVVASLDEGINASIPTADDEDNHGWNTYKKDLAIGGKVVNMHAPQLGGHGQPESGEFTKFNFTTGKVTTSETDWDIAFRGTKVIINGGVSSGITDEPARNGDAAAYVTTGIFNEIIAVETDKLEQDTADAYIIKGWYNYTGNPDHLIIPIAGKVIVLKTRDGKYAKLEIFSYYKDDNTDKETKEGRYYTFNYAYQPNGNPTF